MKRQFLMISTVLLLLTKQSLASESYQSELTLADEVSWGHLNPLRGEKSPGAANLWGDRTADTETGMLVRFKKGFSSPPHIHNISYRGIVIDGLVHNDDPGAEKMWMPTGSYWTQPAGEVHVTAANAVTNLIYLEIDRGPYLVKPSKDQFDNGERPMNMHANNIVWLGNKDASYINQEGIEAAKLWKNKSITGSLIKVPIGFNLTLNAHAEEFKVVIISGKMEYSSKERPVSNLLVPGSYFSSSGDFDHHISAVDDLILYVRFNGNFLVSDRKF